MSEPIPDAAAIDLPPIGPDPRRPLWRGLLRAILIAFPVCTALVLAWAYLGPENPSDAVEQVAGIGLFLVLPPALTVWLLRDTAWWVRALLVIPVLILWIWWMLGAVAPVVDRLDHSGDGGYYCC